MQSHVVPLTSKLEHLLRDRRILTEVLLVDSDEPDYSVSLKTVNISLPAAPVVPPL